jgi:hypothetical protein
MGMGSLPYYGQAANQALAAQPMMQAGLGMAGRNYGFLSGAADVGNNPYVQQMMQANAGILNEQLQEQWLPALESGFSRTGAGAVGSSRHGLAQSEAIQNTAKELGRSNAGLLLGAYGQGLGAQQNALGQTGNMLRNLMVPSAATADAAAYLDQGGRTGLQYGQATEGYQQRALDDAMARFGWQYQEPWMRAQSLGGILGSLQPLGRSYNAGSSAGNIPNPNYQSGGNAFLQGALGGAGVGYNIWDRWNQSRSGSQMGLNYGQHANSLANTVYPF